MLIVDERNIIQTELVGKGFDLFDYFENTKVSDLKSFCLLPLKRRSDLLLVDAETVRTQPELLEKFKSVMNTFSGIIFFYDQENKKSQDWLTLEASLLQKIIGDYSFPMSQLRWTILSNQLQFFWNNCEEQRYLQKHIAKFSQELDQLLQTTESEVNKAKKIHEILIPKRNEELKGIHFISKYAVGEGGGSEFFDLHSVGNKIFLIVMSCQSYLVSSALLSILGTQKQTGFEPNKFLKDAQDEIENIGHTRRRKSDTDLLVLEIDSTSLQMSAWGDSKVELYSQKTGKVFKMTDSETYRLSRGEKIIVFSSGFLFNWSQRASKQEMTSFLKQNEHLRLSELLTEMFFQLKKENTALAKDSTVLMMEIKRHGIHQI